MKKNATSSLEPPITEDPDPIEILFSSLCPNNINSMVNASGMSTNYNIASFDHSSPSSLSSSRFHSFEIDRAVLLLEEWVQAHLWSAEGSCLSFSEGRALYWLTSGGARHASGIKASIKGFRVIFLSMDMSISVKSLSPHSNHSMLCRVSVSILVSPSFVLSAEPYWKFYLLQYLF